MRKSNVKKWIKKKKDEYGEPQAILVQTNNLEPWTDDADDQTLYQSKEIDKALEMLDQDFDSGYSSENGPRFLVWFEDYVMGKSIYDGSEGTFIAPRNPKDEADLYPVGGW